ncbi:MAG: NUDIX domain-containing protein [Verrucomicrobiae bacterium]|nr:NUDIX domain-containing protein [Verrucomicrobiae bacterium]
MYRCRGGRLEVFLARPGGPWFPHRNHDIWTIPKGEVERGENLLEAAIREFREEVGLEPHGPYHELGSVRQRGGKTVHAWAFEGDWDEREPIRSAQVEVEWPAGSGQWSVWPEIERAAFFPMPQAREHMKVAQQPFLDRLAALRPSGAGAGARLGTCADAHPGAPAAPPYSFAQKSITNTSPNTGFTSRPNSW